MKLMLYTSYGRAGAGGSWQKEEREREREREAKDVWIFCIYLAPKYWTKFKTARGWFLNGSHVRQKYHDLQIDQIDHRLTYISQPAVVIYCAGSCCSTDPTQGGGEIYHSVPEYKDPLCTNIWSKQSFFLWTQIYTRRSLSEKGNLYVRDVELDRQNEDQGDGTRKKVIEYR